MLKLVMVGSRGHYGYVLNGLSQLDDVELAAVSTGCEDPADRLLASCDRLCKVRPRPPVFGDYIEMLDAVRPDLVCVDGPFDRHAEMSIECMKRGANVLCEKPAALTLGDLERIRQTWRAAGEPHFASMVFLRYRAPFLKAYELVRRGAIGKIKLITTQKSYQLGARPEFYKNRAAYGGTIPWVGSHALDWILWFSGCGFRELYARHTASDNRDHGEMEIAAQCQCTMENGILAQASMEFLRPAAAPTHGDDRLRLAGADGVLEIVQNVITLINADGVTTIDCSAEPDADGFVDFVNHVTGPSKALIDASQTFMLTEACLLARESADRGAPMEVPVLSKVL